MESREVTSGDLSSPSKRRDRRCVTLVMARAAQQHDSVARRCMALR